MIFARRLKNEGHTRQFTIERSSSSGWVAREGDEGASAKTSNIRDWHQVEATIALFQMKASALKDEGWAEA